MNVSGMIKALECGIKKSAPTILSIVGSIGVVATGILSAKSALTIEKNLKKAEGKELTTKEKLKEFVAPAIPAVVTAGVSITCIMAGNNAHRKIETNLSTACAAIEGAYIRYREKAKSLGHDEEIAKEVSRDMIDHSRKNHQVSVPDLQNDEFEFVIDVPDNDQFYFITTLDGMYKAEQAFNELFQEKESVSVNEFYECINAQRGGSVGAEYTEYGEYAGWSKFLGASFYGYSDIKFEHILCTDPNGNDYYLVHPQYMPVVGYDDCEDNMKEFV